MNIGDFLDRGAISLGPLADTKRQALMLVAETAARAFAPLGFRTRAGEVLDALMEREADGSTGVGRGVALPHARLQGLDRMRAVLVRLDKPAPFNAVDDQPVDLLFALFAPEKAGSEHLRALARVSRLFRQGDVLRQLRLARSPDVVYALLGRDAEATAA